MSGAVAVRPAREEDLGAIVEIEEETFSEAWKPETFASGLRREDMVVLVAAEGGAVVGYAVVVVGRREAELANLAVSATRRGRGTGEALLAGVLDVMRERGVGLAYLAVRASNEQAARLYRRFGFRDIGSHDGYYSEPREDALVLALELEL